MGKKSKEKENKKLAKNNAHANGRQSGAGKPKLENTECEAELFKLQGELVKLQDWVKKTRARIVIVFEGRDAAGKGGIIKRILERVSPRVFRLVALRPRLSGRRRRFMHRDTLRICPPEAKWSSSTAVGTTGPVSSASWASAPKRSTSNS